MASVHGLLFLPEMTLYHFRNYEKFVTLSTTYFYLVRSLDWYLDLKVDMHPFLRFKKS